MKIVHLSTYDSGNGAAIAAYRIHTSLIRLGHDSTLFVAHRRLNDATVVQFQPGRTIGRRLRRRLRTLRIARGGAAYPRLRAPDLEFFSDDRGPHGADVIAQIPAADIINVHAMFDFLDYREFLEVVPRRAPVVRTLHDMSFFTGGCHIAGACTKFTDRCGACPRLNSAAEHDLSRAIWTRKHTAFASVPPHRLHMVTPSRWLAAEAQRSSLTRNFPVAVIPFGVDTEIFRPRDRRAARDFFSIPQDANVVVFVAQPIHRVNKGFAMLAEALDGLATTPNLVLLSAGSGRPPVQPRVSHIPLGNVGDERLLSLVYAAADVVVLPSMNDNLPLTALEALACGRPVVAFGVGGLLDIVRPHVGILVPPRDVKALGEAVGRLLSDVDGRIGLELACRSVAVEDYSLERQARRYVELYETILRRADDGRMRAGATTPRSVSASA